jgi:hypothetical protein
MFLSFHIGCNLYGGGSSPRGSGDYRKQKALVEDMEIAYFQKNLSTDFFFDFIYTNTLKNIIIHITIS